MGKMVMRNREAEVALQKRMHYCSTLISIAFNAYPIVATIVCLIGYVIIDGKQLTPEIAFLTLLLFNSMRASIYAIPSLIQRTLKAKISFDRIQNFLFEDEVPTLQNTMEPSSKDTILELNNATFSWAPEISADTVPVLKSINIEIKEAELIGIIGRVGAGKSSILSAICGELYQISGQFYRKPDITIAYVPQEAWIQNLSLRDNILFGKIYDEKMYQKTIEVCALKDDLKQFAAGDETEIGERGLNLSGGQKARVALARAVYQCSDLYILDDTLSAVDSHVGTHIFQNVIGNEAGILKDKTRIFALNSINFLSKCDKIAVLKEGNLVDFGTFEELSSRKNITFVELVKELKVKAEHQQDDLDLNDDDATPAQLKKQKRNLSSDNPKTPLLDQNISTDGKLIKDEITSAEKQTIKIYSNYLKAFGLKLAFGYFITLFVKYFSTTCVHIRRLASGSSSKVTSHTQESYVGVPTLRIFGAQKMFCQKMINYITKVAEAKFTEKIAIRWSQLMMELFISIFSSIFIIIAMYFGHVGILNPSSVALVVSTGIMLKGFFGDIIHEIIAIESNAVSVERVQEYIGNEHEAEWISTKNIAEPNWPSEGNIEFKDFSLRYRPSTPLVLKKLNLHIAGGQKIGIVGR
uniref:Uncharacterized protein n=1 Tax=Panagrolaimus sp. ES5 TaxID=591445 RepID=A0AC34F450_9BILA